MIRILVESIVAIALGVIGGVGLFRPGAFRSVVLTQRKRPPFAYFAESSAYNPTLRLIGVICLALAILWALDAWTHYQKLTT